MNVYVLLDWREGDETSKIVGVYVALEKAQAALPFAEWRQDAYDKARGIWYSALSQFSIETHPFTE